MTNVLISSAGRRGELVRIFQESLRALGGGGGVFTIDRSPLSAAGWMSDGLDLVPPIGDPRFIEAVLNVCRARAIRHLVPTIDTELPVYAASRHRFVDAGVEVWVSDPDLIAIASNKRMTNEWLRERSMPAPTQLDLRAALDAPDLVYPLIAKPASGSSSIGLARISDPRQLHMLDPALDYVIEEIVPGVEYTVDVLVDLDGRAAASVPRRRLETRAGEVSKGVTAAVPAVQTLAESVVSQLPGARGVLNVQVFHDAESDALHVIEVNARFGGGFPLSWAAGARFPLRLLQWHSGSDPTAPVSFEPGTLMLRYDAAVVLHVGAEEFGV